MGCPFSCNTGLVKAWPVFGHRRVSMSIDRTRTEVALFFSGWCGVRSFLSAQMLSDWACARKENPDVAIKEKYRNS